MAFDQDARKFSVSWDGGNLTTTVGVLKALYGPDWEGTVGAGAAKTVNVKSHTRTRIIGGPTTSVSAYGYNVIDYPSRRRGGGAGGQAIRILLDGSFWTARLQGSVQDFKAFLAGVGKPLKPFTFLTEKGSEYSSAA